MSQSVMDELEKTVRYQDIPEEDYGILITDGQAPKNTGKGNITDIVWDEGTDLRLIDELQIKAKQMVSEELLETSDCTINQSFLNQQVFSIFPIDPVRQRHCGLIRRDQVQAAL